MAGGETAASQTIQGQFCSIFTITVDDVDRDLRHVMRSEFVNRRTVGSFQLFHYTGIGLGSGTPQQDIECAQAGVDYFAQEFVKAKLPGGA